LYHIQFQLKDINKLIELTRTNKEGTTFYNIKVASEEIGLETKAFKLDDIKLLKNKNALYMSDNK